MGTSVEQDEEWDEEDDENGLGKFFLGTHILSTTNPLAAQVSQASAIVTWIGGATIRTPAAHRPVQAHQDNKSGMTTLLKF